MYFPLYISAKCADVGRKIPICVSLMYELEEKNV